MKIKHHQIPRLVRTGIILTLFTPFHASFAAQTSAEPTKAAQVNPQLGSALPAPNTLNLYNNASRNPRAVPANNTGGWTIDTNNRQLVRAFYNSVYQASENTPINWSGNTSGCNPGSTGSDFKNSVLARINYYRAMAGVPANITLNPTYNAKAQEAALMMSANNSLSHFPPTSWNCYTADGAEAAGSSNISFGHNGWNAVSGQMRDNGPNNTEVGHRKWLLHPPTQEMGTGDVADSGSLREANAVWIMDGRFFDAFPTIRDGFSAWPTVGYNPYQVVPTRWSFTYPDADFSGASVSVLRNGSNVPLSIDFRDTGNKLSSIVWRPYNNSADSSSARWTQPAFDETYTVTVSNVMINGSPQNFNYDITIIDPQVALNGEENISISGDSNPTPGTTSTYSFNSMSLAESYNVLNAELSSSDTTYDAEDGGANTTDGTDSSYSLIYAGGGSNGTSVYRLAPATDSEFVIFDGSYIPSPSSTLSFSSKLGYATTGQTAAVQISSDNGASWSNVYTLQGTTTASGADSQVQTSFQSQSISLAAYSNKIVKIRALFSHTGFRFNGTDASVSFLLDNLNISNTQQLLNTSIRNNGTSTSFDLTPESGKTYALAAQAVPWTGYPAMDWGELLIVGSNGTNNPEPPPNNSCLTRTNTASDTSILNAYISYYGRCPDLGGFNYWSGRLASENGDLGSIIDAFGNSPEFTNRFSHLSDSDLVNNVYMQMFKRSAESAGLAYYENRLATGQSTLAKITLDVMFGAQDNDQLTLDAKNLVCSHYMALQESDSSVIFNESLAYQVTQAVDYTSDTGSACGLLQ